MIAPAGKLRLESMVSLCLVLLLPLLAVAAEPPAPVDFSEGFDADPALDPGWELTGSWSWNGEKGVLASTPGCADSAVWLGTKLTAGLLGARLMLQNQPGGTAPRASLVFARQDAVNYRYATLVGGSAATTGKVILGQKGVVGGLPEGRFASAAVDVPTGTWLKLKLRLAPSGAIKAYLNGKVVAVTPKGAPVAPVEGETGLETGGRARLDHFWFLHAYRQVISGRVEDQVGVPVQFSNGGGAAVTQNAGFYTHAVPWGWSGTATAFLEGQYPVTSREYRSVTDDFVDQDFPSYAEDRPIWGHVLAPGGEGLGGVTVRFSDGVDAVTDGSGLYRRKRPSTWPCTATPEADGWSFDPPSKTYEDFRYGYPDEDYAASPHWPVISGSLLNEGAGGIAGASLYFEGLEQTIPTGTDGSYLKAVPPGWSGRVRPSGGGWAFEPPFVDYDPVETNLPGQDYDGRRTFLYVGGWIRPVRGWVRSGISVLFSGGQGRSLTDSAGNFAKAIPAGWRGSVTPSFNDWDFSPPSGHYPESSWFLFDAFPKPERCIPCHDSTPFFKGAAAAPNVMGDGYMFDGDPAHATPRRYDDGSWGFNVNGHGRDADTADVSHADLSPRRDINAMCVDCHDLEQSPETHLDGINQGRDGSASANTFHLRIGYVRKNPVNPWDVQVDFDGFCRAACHRGAAVTDMRHSINSIPAPNAMELGTCYTYDEPQNTPPPWMYIDRDLTSLAAFEGAPKYGTCVSCHNPHGTGTVSPRADGNNKMVLYRWYNPSILCAKCHY